VIELIKWGGPWAAFILFALREFRERRQIETVLKRYEEFEAQHNRQLLDSTGALTQLIERLEPGSALTKHISSNTQVLTLLCERIEAWDRRMGAR
jgi:hypothetical protein